ncbi:MAG TPA: hypothetical protein VN838_30150 [Bradyrhizobium sp.]|nr:hypothetical protein [Bradyrhizobium sp.]
MKRSSNITRSIAAMPKDWRYVLLHAAAAALFIFLLQRFALSASLDSALLWALTFGGCAAGLAYSQIKR